MSFHKAADAPSHSINSLAPTERHEEILHQNDIREYGGFFFFFSMEIPVMFSLIHQLTEAAAPCHSHHSGVMDWHELIMKPNSNRSFDY